MEPEGDVATVAALIANRPRAAMLDLLLDGQAHPAGDLAREARIAPSTASGHLIALMRGRLVVVERIGRQRRYRLAGSDVATALEALATLAPQRATLSLRQATAAEYLRSGRTCYDHLAGRLGVSVTDALVTRRAIRLRDGAFDVTRSGEVFLEDIGVDVAGARDRQRRFALPCLDWTERRYHLAGALGAAVCDRLFELGWIRCRPSGRAVVMTSEGSVQLGTMLGINPKLPTPEL
jgi:DNA-binding transcriptional ArsR family regulator